MKRATSSSGRCVAESPIRCSGRPSSCASSRSSVSARCAPRLVAATAWISSTITASTSREDLARLRGQHQVERLGRRDQDVGRRAQHRRALAGRRVAGADRDAHVVAEAEAAQRRAQVALDVVGERLQRRDVDQPRAVLAGRRRRRRDEAIERPEERGERLARAGRRADQHVLAGRDRRPRLRLRRRRRLERALEPVADQRGEGGRAARPTTLARRAGRAARTLAARGADAVRGRGRRRPPAAYRSGAELLQRLRRAARRPGSVMSITSAGRRQPPPPVVRNRTGSS